MSFVWRFIFETWFDATIQHLISLTIKLWKLLLGFTLVNNTQWAEHLPSVLLFFGAVTRIKWSTRARTRTTFKKWQVQNLHEGSLVNIFESMETIDEIKERSLRIDSLYTLSTIYQEALPLLGLDKIKKYQTNFKEFPMSTLMAELPVTKLQPMGWSNWVESPWFYVGLTLAVIFTLGICIKMRKTVRKMGSICCGSCWSRCRRRDGDGGEEDSSKGPSYCCVNPETSNQTIELRNISASKKPRYSRKYEAGKTDHSTESFAHQLMDQKEDVESHWSKYYRPNPEFARRYLEEIEGHNVCETEEYRGVPWEGILPSAPNLYPIVPMMYE